MQLPPDDVLVAIIRRYARLRSAVGEETGKRPLVLPTEEFFPDKFSADAPSAARLVARMQRHAGLEDVPLDVQVEADDSEPAVGSSCSSGACAVPTTPQGSGGLSEHGDGWRLTLPVALLRSPVALTTHVARALGVVFLLETAEDDALLAEADVEGELASVALGFGPLLLAGSYVYSKSCGGPSVAKLTTLSTPELAVACALFAHTEGHKLRPAIAELEATQQALLTDADAWAASNASVVQKLREAPERLLTGDVPLSESKPWLLRLFNREKPRRKDQDLLADPDASLEELEAMASTAARSPARAKRADAATADLRVLVEEALEESRASAR